MKSSEKQLRHVRPSVLWVGNRIRELREELNMTQAQLAKLLEVQDSRIGDFEYSRHDIKLTTLLRVCKQLSVEPNEFFDGCPRL